jgi:hypothetical protein
MAATARAFVAPMGHKGVQAKDDQRRQRPNDD